MTLQPTPLPADPLDIEVGRDPMALESEASASRLGLFDGSGSTNELPAATVPVLHVVNGEHYSGAERVQDLLAGALPKFGYSVGFASLKAGKFGDYRSHAEAPLHEVRMRGRWDLGVVARIAALIRDEGYQLVHAHTPRSLLVAHLAARRARVPLVYHVHSPASRDSTRWFANQANALVERVCVSDASKLITVSPTLTDHMRRSGVPEDKLTCVLNGVPCHADEGVFARRRRPPITPFVIAMVALFRPRKGAEVLLDAIAALRSREIDVRLKAIGPFETREYEQKLHDRVNRLDLNEVVQWVGFADDVPAALGKADALALPSLFGEGLPMVVLEAMATGMPVVATRCEGTTEAILHRKTGFLVEPGSVSQLTDALEELFSGETDYPSMALAARERHAERFSDQAMAWRVAGVYDEVLGSELSS